MLKRLLDKEKAKWKILPNHYLNSAGKDMLLLKINKGKNSCVFEQLHIPLYYKQTINAWHCCKNTKTEMPQTAREIRKQIIWGNRWITFNKKSLWFNKWITQNIVHVNDLFDEHGNFKEESLFQTLGNYGDSLIDMYKVQNAISKQ